MGVAHNALRIPLARGKQAAQSIALPDEPEGVVGLPRALRFLSLGDLYQLHITRGHAARR